MVRRELKQPSPACLSSGFGCDNEIAKIGVTRSAFRREDEQLAPILGRVRAVFLADLKM